MVGWTSEVGREASRNMSRPWKSLAGPTQWISEMDFAARKSRERAVERWPCLVSDHPPMVVGPERLMEEGEERIGAGVGRMLG